MTSLEATDEAVARVSGACELLGRKTDVALRFVEWFSAKGEAFEHNASAVERHLNALAAGNRAVGGGGGGGGHGASSLPRFPADIREKIFGGGDPARAAAYSPLTPAGGGGAAAAAANEPASPAEAVALRAAGM